MTVVASNLKITTRKQKTLKNTSFFKGIGIHTGKEVEIRFCPAEEATGIVFKRVDLANEPIIPATLKYVQNTSRCTTIGLGDIQIHTVEHVLSAIRAYQIDNVCIEISNIEPPVGNGSADVFVEMIENSGIVEQNGTVPIIKIQEPIYWSEGDIQLIALPSDNYRISYTLSYPESPLLRAQFHTVIVNPENFKREIAPCRTFSLGKEISFLIDQGLIKGGSLDNAVVIKDDVILCKGGLFFPDEMVRHKILDLIGDLSLIGFNFEAHIIGIRSGHSSNFAFASRLLNHINHLLTERS